MAGDSILFDHRLRTSGGGSRTPSGEAPFTFDLSRIALQGYSEGKIPLFVLGSGVSAGLVPLLHEMAGVLLDMIQDEKALPDDMKKQLVAKGTLISEGLATRADAAEFFSLLQESEELEKNSKGIWQKFCGLLLYDGLTVDRVKYTGLVQPVKTSKAHNAIGKMVAVGACHVLNLNYDPLLYVAMKELRLDYGERKNLNLIALHSAEDIARYYSSSSKEFQPAVVNARGDVFFARCANPLCPKFRQDQTLDYASARPSWDEYRVCPICHLDSLRVHLSFPGYEAKEQLVIPLLNQYRYFVADQTSILITIGLSGQWDPHLLEILFRWALDYRLHLLDVRLPPQKGGEEPFEQFRRRYFPEACYHRINSDADHFMEMFMQTVRPVFTRNMKEFDRPQEQKTLRLTNQ